MDVKEVLALAQWLEDYVNPAMPKYEDLAVAMEHNASNTSKVPLRDHLDALRLALQQMPVSQLTYQQTDLLGLLEADDLFGDQGWYTVERAVKEGNYDPASAAADIRKAKQRIERALGSVKQARQSLTAIGLQGEPKYDSSDKVTVRIRFKDGVEISNVTQLKKWTAEWYEISRGLSIAAGEMPEDVEVKGATTGSLILVLGTTLSVATAIALIMKQVASTVKWSMEIAHTLQDWKMRRVADAEVERVLLERRKRIEDGGVATALELVKHKLGAHVSGEVENALKKSIEKMFSFAAKGGEVDMLPPPVPSAEDEIDQATAEAINTIIENVEEMRTLKAETQLLIEDKGDEAPEGNAANGDEEP